MLPQGTRLWHLLTPEFPPGCGGVGDYSALVAAALADAGDVVHVWYPRPSQGTVVRPPATRVTVHELPDRFGRPSRRELERAFARVPGVVLVQYVPTAFGLRGGNVPFCRWLLRLRRSGADVRVMFHEPFFYFGLERPWRNALAVTQRVMAALLIRASATLYFSTESWFKYLAPLGPVSGAVVLPVPSTIPADPPESLVERWRSRLGEETVIGHFGTYGEHMSGELEKVLPAIWRALPRARVLLIGDGSEAFAERLRGAAPTASTLQATGRIAPIDVAAAFRACDVLVAPYPDGVTTRRTSAMAALSSGRPVVTTDGALTEPVWRTSGPLLVPAGDPGSFAREVARITSDRSQQIAVGMSCRRMYDERFDLSHTIRALRQASLAVPVS